MDGDPLGQCLEQALLLAVVFLALFFGHCCEWVSEKSARSGGLDGCVNRVRGREVPREVLCKSPVELT